MELTETARLDLMRLMDGELPPERAAEVARVARQDPAAASFLVGLEADRALLRAAFPLEETSGPPARAALDRGFAARRRRQATVARWRAAMPIAASVLVAALLGTGAVLLAEHRAADIAGQVIAAQAKDRELMAVAFAQALDSRRSGQMVSWQNPDSGSSGSFMPLRTFRAADGRWCREYEQRLDQGGATDTRLGIACRDAGGWQLELERPSEA